jgi:hypothetical protein
MLEPSALLAALTPVEPALLIGGSTSRLSYTYGELNYLYSDLDGVPGTQSGYQVAGSWNPILGFFILGSYSNGNGATDIETSKIGGGYHIGIGDRLDVFGQVTYEHLYGSSGGASASDDGYEFDAGARFMLLDSLEINGQLEWNHVDEDDFGVQLGARWHLAGPLSIGGTVETIDQDFRATIGARFQL